MTSMAPDPFETLRAELVEGLPRMILRVMEGGKGEAQAAIEQLARIRATLTMAGDLDDFLADIEAAERALLVYLLT